MCFSCALFIHILKNLLYEHTNKTHAAGSLEKRGKILWSKMAILRWSCAELMAITRRKAPAGIPRRSMRGEPTRSLRDQPKRSWWVTKYVLEAWLPLRSNAAFGSQFLLLFTVLVTIYSTGYCLKRPSLKIYSPVNSNRLLYASIPVHGTVWWSFGYACYRHTGSYLWLRFRRIICDELHIKSFKWRVSKTSLLSTITYSYEKWCHRSCCVWWVNLSVFSRTEIVQR